MKFHELEIGAKFRFKGFADENIKVDIDQYVPTVFIYDVIDIKYEVEDINDI